jgi:hypothetical protein
VAFARCRTSSTRAIESFQRNPNGGRSSSTGYTCAAERRMITTLIKIRRIACLQLRIQPGSRFVILGVGRPHFRLASQYHPGGVEIACTAQLGQITPKFTQIPVAGLYAVFLTSESCGPVNCRNFLFFVGHVCFAFSVK